MGERDSGICLVLPEVITLQMYSERFPTLFGLILLRISEILLRRGKVSSLISPMMSSPMYEPPIRLSNLPRMFCSEF